MQLFILFCYLFVVYGAPTNDADTQLLRYEFERKSDGHGYEFKYETSDGTKREEEATFDADDPENNNLVVRGEYEYVGPDGITYKVTYTADKDGFHPQGDHLPMLPENVQVDQQTEEPVLLALPPAVIASLLG